jgi:hypothetical protein
MEKIFAFLISVGLMALGVWIVAGTKWESDPLLAWGLLGTLPAAIGSMSLYLAIRDVKIA